MDRIGSGFVLWGLSEAPQKFLQKLPNRQSHIATAYNSLAIVFFSKSVNLKISLKKETKEAFVLNLVALCQYDIASQYWFFSFSFQPWDLRGRICYCLTADIGRDGPMCVNASVWNGYTIIHVMLVLIDRFLDWRCCSYFLLPHAQAPSYLPMCT